MSEKDPVLYRTKTKVLKSVREKEEKEFLPNLPEKKKKRKVGRYIGRFFITFGLLLAFLVVAVVLTCNVLLNGPSETMRDMLVLSARQASATKWIPGLFIGNEMTEEIERNSKKVVRDVVKMEDDTPGTDDPAAVEDEWANAIDGILLHRITKPGFKAYVMIIRDPGRVFVGISSNFQNNQVGMRIFQMVKKYNAVAGINGGEFLDPGGVGTGNNPMGITYSEGALVWSDGLTNRTFMGFDTNNKLIVTEGMNRAKAEALSIRDGVCFQTGNSLITNDGENMTLHYADGDTGVAQRTCIGQRQDGAVIFLVTDGRAADSLGATHNDCINLLREYGAVTAGQLDGGSSAMMYYRDYFDLYHLDKSLLDQYQLQGLVNKYKAFTSPRMIPTYFLVRESGSND